MKGLELPPGMANQVNERMQVAVLLLQVSTNVLTSVLGTERDLGRAQEEWSSAPRPSKQEQVGEAMEYGMLLLEAAGICRFDRHSNKTSD